MPRSIFLIPGVGAQGGRPELLGAAFAAGPRLGAGRRLARHRRRPDPAAAAERPARRGLGRLHRLRTAERGYTITALRSTGSDRPSMEQQRTSSLRPDPRRSRPGGGGRRRRRRDRPRRTDGRLGRTAATAASGRRSKSDAGADRAKTYVVKSGDTPDLDRPRDRGPGRARSSAAQPRSRPPDPDRRRDAEAAMSGARAAARCAAAARPLRRSRRRPAAGRRDGRRGRSRPALEARAWAADRRPHRRGARLPRRRRAAADRQHDEADDRLRGDAGAAARPKSCGPRPTTPIYGESLLGTARRAAGQRSRPALRADPAQRQRRRLRPRPRRRRLPGRASSAR